MAEPWKCPECGVILAPWVSEHRCDGGSAVPAVTPAPSPAAGGGIVVTSPAAAKWVTTNVSSGTLAGTLTLTGGTALTLRSVA